MKWATAGLAFVLVVISSMSEGFAYTLAVSVVQYLIEPASQTVALEILPSLSSWVAQHLSDSGRLLFLTSLTFGVYCLRTLLSFAAMTLMGSQQERALAACRSKFFSRSMSFTKSTFDGIPIGKLSHDLIHSTGRLTGLIPSVRGLVTSAATLTGYLVVMTRLSVPLSAVAAIMLYLAFMLSRKLHSSFQAGVQRQWENIVKLSSSAADLLSFAPTIRLFAGHQAAKERFNAITNSLAKGEIEFSRSQSRLYALTEVLAIGFMLGLASAYHGLSAAKLLVNQPGMLVFFIAMHRAANTLNEIHRGVKDLKSVDHAVKDVREIVFGHSYLAEPDTTLGEKFPEKFEELLVEDLTFGYLPGAPVINKLQLRLVSGQKVLLHGPSGTGKSTLAHLLMRLVEPSVGRISVNGRPVQDYALGSYRTHICCVSQDLNFIDDTFAQNITFGLERQVDDFEIKDVVSIVCLDSWAAQQPDGIHTAIGAQGGRMSGGQRQRLAIARALIRKPDLLILDEATSNLDLATEREVLTNIFNAMPETAIICITHRDLSYLPHQTAANLHELEAA